MNETEEIRAWLRENAKRVKTFEVDELFTGLITTYEGEERLERSFEDFEELKDFYGDRTRTKSGKTIGNRLRKFVNFLIRKIKSALQEPKP